MMVGVYRLCLTREPTFRSLLMRSTWSGCSVGREASDDSQRRLLWGVSIVVDVDEECHVT